MPHHTTHTVRYITIMLLATTSSAAFAQDANPVKPKPLEEIVITGTRKIKDARVEQKKALNIINVQAAEEIAKYPDFNAAEALSRVPGISLSSDTGEGRFVNVRGLDGNLNGATFGGVVLLNTNPGGTVFGTGRAVEFDTVPINAVDRIVVTKSILPDHDAEGLGGTIEITPRNALNVKDLLVEGIVGGIYEPLRSTKGYRAELALGKKWEFGDGQKFAVLLSGSLNEDRRGVDDVEAGYIDGQPTVPDKAFNGLELRRYQYNRKRFSYGVDVQYQPNDRNSFYLDYSTAGYVETVNRQRRVYNFNDPTALVDPSNRNGFITLPMSDPTAGGTTVDSTLRNERETHRNVVISIGGKTKFDALTVDYRSSYSRATFSKPFDYNNKFTNSATLYGVQYDNTTNPNFPTVKFPAGTDLTNPANYGLAGFFNSTETDRDREWSGAVNVTVPVALGGADGKVKLGGSIRLRYKSSNQNNQNFSALPALTLDKVLGGGPFAFYNNTLDVGYTTSATSILNFYNTNLISFTPDTNKNIIANAQAFFDNRENVYAGYAQYQVDLDQLNVLAGVRVENTSASYLANVVTTGNDANGNVEPKAIIPTKRDRDYTNFFPSVQLSYKFTPELVVRAVYSTAIGRPGFSQVSAGSRLFREAGPSNGTVNTGNTDLKPTTSNNFDISLEYYLNNSGVISVGGFYKKFKNYVVATSVVGTFPGVIGPIKRVTFANIGGSRAQGLEANYNQRFAFLPAPFDGVGINGNVTLTDTKIEIHPGQFGSLPAASKFTYNAALFYEAHGVEARLSASYVSKSLFQIGSSFASDVYQDNRFSLDLTSTYDFTPNVGVYFNAKNLTNTPLRYYEATSNRPTQREFYEATYEAGLKFKF